MTDFIDGLQQDLVGAARRQAGAWRTAAGVRRRRASRRGLGLALAGLVVAGSAAAAVVGLTAAEPSRPLAGPVRLAAPSARSYAISLHPDLMAGQIGWCAVARFASGGRVTSRASGCGGAPSAGGGAILASAHRLGRDAIELAVVTGAVRAVRFADGRLVATRADRTLPYGWRYAVATGARVPRWNGRPPAGSPYLQPGLRPSQAEVLAPVLPGRAPVLFDAAGRTIPFDGAHDRDERHTLSRVVSPGRPARRCVIGDAPGFVALHARVATSQPAAPRAIEGRTFGSCADTLFRVRGARRTLSAAILLDGQRPQQRAPQLPPASDLSARRLGRGWLVVSGGRATDRLRLLHRLPSRL